MLRRLVTVHNFRMQTNMTSVALILKVRVCNILALLTVRY
jgi:hypothetical protein